MASDVSLSDTADTGSSHHESCLECNGVSMLDKPVSPDLCEWSQTKFCPLESDNILRIDMTPFRPRMAAMESGSCIVNDEIVVARLLVELQQHSKRLCIHQDEALQRGLEELAIRFIAATQYQRTTSESLNSLIHNVHGYQESLLDLKSGLRILEDRFKMSSGSAGVSDNFLSSRHLINKLFWAGLSW